jgi:hypothetical protein
VFLFAQRDVSRYVFEDFKEGKLVYKKGNAINSLFNYNTLDESMMFLSNDSTLYELTNTEEVLYANIDGRIFEHIKGGLFYERINAGKEAFYIRWKSKNISKGKSSGYGMTSQAGSISNIETFGKDGRMVKLGVNENFELKSENFYYIKIKKDFKRFSSADSLSKLFKNNADDIKEYAKRENLNFNNLEDIKKAVEYCSQYMPIDK